LARVNTNVGNDFEIGQCLHLDDTLSRCGCRKYYCTEEAS
jgi:hypothetical protein